jgi:hypothetical protein
VQFLLQKSQPCTQPLLSPTQEKNMEDVNSSESFAIHPSNEFESVHDTVIIFTTPTAKVLLLHSIIIIILTAIMIRRRTIITPTFLVAMISLATMRSSHAFQHAHKNSPLHVPNRVMMPPKMLFAAPPLPNNNLNLLLAPSLGRSAATATMLRASNINDENDANENANNKAADDGNASTSLATQSHDDSSSSNNNQVIQNLASSMKQFLSTHFLSIAIFLLPLFLSANDAWAVQSGGRMGGSFGGSSRSSSSRTYSAPSSGYSRGYYSRPTNVIVTPGISPFYR